MVPANQIAFWSQLTVFSPPDEKLIARNLYFLTCIATLEHLEHDFHLVATLDSMREMKPELLLTHWPP
jgi:hypothetical protein